MRIGSDKKVISVDQISEVRIPNKKYGKLVGFLIGAGIDAVGLNGIKSNKSDGTMLFLTGLFGKIISQIGTMPG